MISSGSRMRSGNFAFFRQFQIAQGCVRQTTGGVLRRAAAHHRQNFVPAAKLKHTLLLRKSIIPVSRFFIGCRFDHQKKMISDSPFFTGMRVFSLWKRRRRDLPLNSFFEFHLPFSLANSKINTDCPSMSASVAERVEALANGCFPWNYSFCATGSVTGIYPCFRRIAS